MRYSDVLEQCRLFYPNWLSRESSQITQGRLNDALELLAYMGWLEFKGTLSSNTQITVHFSKGDRMRVETFDFLTKKYVELLSDRAKRTVRRRKMPSSRALRVTPVKTTDTLDKFLK